MSGHNALNPDRSALQARESARQIISKGEAIRQLCHAGVFASYAEARNAGVHDALAVSGIAYNMTTAERVAEIYGVTMGATEEDEQLAAHAGAVVRAYREFAESARSAQ